MKKKTLFRITTCLILILAIILASACSTVTKTTPKSTTTPTKPTTTITTTLTTTTTATVSGNTTGTIATQPVASGASNEASFYLTVTSSTVAGITPGQQILVAALTTDFPNLLAIGATLTGNLGNSPGWWILKPAGTAATITTPVLAITNTPTTTSTAAIPAATTTATTPAATSSTTTPAATSTTTTTTTTSTATTPTTTTSTATTPTTTTSITTTPPTTTSITTTPTPTTTTTVTLPANPTAPVLGTSSLFVILASQKVTTTGTTAVSNGAIGIIDQARSYYAGFTPGGATPNSFTQLTNGLSYAHDDIYPFTYPSGYASTIAFINQVRTDLGVAYTFLAADPNPGAPNQACPLSLASTTLTRGVYKTASNVTLTGGNLTLDAQNDPNSVFIITIGGNLTTGSGGNIILKNGAKASNVFFRVAGITVIGGGTSFYGNVFSWQQVNVLAGANITGRLFSVNEQVTLISDTVTAQ